MGHSLEEVDLSPLVNLREVGVNFLRGCSSMKSIDLTPLRAIKVLPDGFLFGCRSLVEVDLSPLVYVVKVFGKGCCEGCTGLNEIVVGPHQSAKIVTKGLRGFVVDRDGHYLQ